MRLIFHIRSFSWLFRRDWYSFHRFRNPFFYGGKKIRLIDIGCFTIGYSTNIWS